MSDYSVKSALLLYQNKRKYHLGGQGRVEEFAMNLTCQEREFNAEPPKQGTHNSRVGTWALGFLLSLLGAGEETGSIRQVKCLSCRRLHVRFLSACLILNVESLYIEGKERRSSENKAKSSREERCF